MRIRTFKGKTIGRVKSLQSVFVAVYLESLREFVKWNITKAFLEHINLVKWMAAYF